MKNQKNKTTTKKKQTMTKTPIKNHKDKKRT